MTKLKRAEEDIRQATEREHFLAEVIENASTPFGVGAPDGSLLLFNRAFAELTGYSREELERRRLTWATDLTPPEWRERETEILGKASRTGETVRYEKEYIRKDGSRVPIELFVQPVLDGKGKVVHYRSFLTDISARKRAEADQARLAGQRQLALDAAAMGWWHYDPVTRVATYDKRYTEIFGVSGCERANDEILKLMHPDDLPRVWAAVEAALDPADPKPYSAEYRVNRLDGEMRWVEAHGLAIFEGEGDARHATSLVGTVADITERKQAEERVRRYASLVRLSQDAIHVRRLGGRIEFWNDGAEALYGFTEQEVLGKNVHELLQTVGSTSVAEVDAILARVGHWEGELAHRSKQGRLVTVSARMQVVRGEEGIERVLQSSRDITERKHAELALQDSKERLAAIVDSIADGFYALDRQWRITHINDTALSYFHRVREEVLGRSLFELFPNFGGSVFETELRRAMETGAPIHVRAPSVVTDRTVEVFGYPSPDTLTILFRDVTEREIQVHRVQRLTQLYAVLSQANEMIVRTRDETQIFQKVCRIVAEQMACPLVWVSLVEGRWVKPVAASGTAAAYLEGIRVEVEGELGQGPTGTCIREDRAMVNDDFAGNPLLSPWREAALRHGIRASAAFPLHKNGKPVGALTLYSKQRAAFDSEQVELLLALAADVSYALDAIEAERLRGNAERALRESERELRDADARKNEFLAMLSHELRNPLAPIRNSLYILAHVRGDGEQVQHAEAVIGRQVAHLTSLVDDLLDVTRVTRGKIRLEKEQLALDEVVGRTVDDHRDLFAKTGVELAFRPGGARLYVQADRTRLSQVVGNLLQNAVKFTPKGGTTTVSVESRENGRAAIRVRDTGAGIGADILPHLFEPFTQADRTLDRSQGGLGLGLALVKGLVEMHDGSVVARSGGPGKGAEFEVVLPTVPASEVAESRPVIEPPPTQPRRVLIIEDNRDAADSLREVLELVNHSAMVAYSGDEGLEKVRAHRPDVVICDIGLPGMDGHAVARAIRADASRSATTLVALTGYAAPEDLARSQEAGFDYHLAKPPSIESIEQVLAEAKRRTGDPQVEE
jgi:PAS domain S-box-containing protein